MVINRFLPFLLLVLSLLFLQGCATNAVPGAFPSLLSGTEVSEDGGTRPVCWSDTGANLRGLASSVSYSTTCIRTFQLNDQVCTQRFTISHRVVNRPGSVADGIDTRRRYDSPRCRPAPRATTPNVAATEQRRR